VWGGASAQFLAAQCVVSRCGVRRRGAVHGCVAARHGAAWGGAARGFRPLDVLCCVVVQCVVWRAAAWRNVWWGGGMVHTGCGGVMLLQALRPDVGRWMTLSPWYWADRPSDGNGGQAPYSAVRTMTQVGLPSLPAV